MPCPGVTCRRNKPLYNRSSALRPEWAEAVEQRALYRQCNRSLNIDKCLAISHIIFCFQKY